MTSGNFLAGLLIGLTAGVGVSVWVLRQQDELPADMQSMNDRQTFTMGWKSDYPNIARCQSNDKGAMVIYRDRERFQRQLNRVYRLLNFGKGVGSEAWFDEQDKAAGKVEVVD